MAPYDIPTQNSVSSHVYPMRPNQRLFPPVNRITSIEHLADAMIQRFGEIKLEEIDSEATRDTLEWYLKENLQTVLDLEVADYGLRKSVLGDCTAQLYCVSLIDDSLSLPTTVRRLFIALRSDRQWEFIKDENLVYNFEMHNIFGYVPIAPPVKDEPQKLSRYESIIS